MYRPRLSFAELFRKIPFYQTFRTVIFIYKIGVEKSHFLPADAARVVIELNGELFVERLSNAHSGYSVHCLAIQLSVKLRKTAPEAQKVRLCGTAVVIFLVADAVWRAVTYRLREGYAGYGAGGKKQNVTHGWNRSGQNVCSAIDTYAFHFGHLL
jgi:hypothetical protein